MSIILLYVHKHACCEGLHTLWFIADTVLSFSGPKHKWKHDRELPFWELGARADPVSDYILDPGSDISVPGPLSGNSVWWAWGQGGSRRGTGKERGRD